MRATAMAVLFVGFVLFDPPNPKMRKVRPAILGFLSASSLILALLGL